MAIHRYGQSWNGKSFGVTCAVWEYCAVGVARRIANGNSSAAEAYARSETST